LVTVNVQTDLDVSLEKDNRGFRLADKGVGPPVNIDYTVTSHDIVLNKGRWDHLLNNVKSVGFNEVNSSTIIERSRRDDDKRILDEPLYWHHGGGHASPNQIASSPVDEERRECLRAMRGRTKV
jgi:hypothetical protein